MEKILKNFTMELVIEEGLKITVLAKNKREAEAKGFFIIENYGGNSLPKTTSPLSFYQNSFVQNVKEKK